MAILTVPVAVPLSGDGLISSIAALIGPKTVSFSGHFTGSFTLLASHDDVDFAPVLLFNADGIEGIEQILEGSFSSVRLRANGNPVPGSPLSCEVSAVVVPGQNKFATVATLAPGASGPAASIDTAALFPPTGLEVGINFICVGALAGAIVIEGSPDNVDWNPICTFSAGQAGARPLVGTLPRLEFSPFRTLDKVRYVRANVSGLITGTTVITIGGGIPAGGGGSSGTKLSFTDSEAKAMVVPPGGADLEGILYEWAVNLNLLNVLITPILSAIISAQGGTPATFNLYIGSTTPGDTTGGTLVATISTASAPEVVASSPGGAFANPNTICLIQITGVVPDVNSQALIRGVNVILDSP